MENFEWVGKFPIQLTKYSNKKILYKHTKRIIHYYEKKNKWRAKCFPLGITLLYYNVIDITPLSLSLSLSLSLNHFLYSMATHIQTCHLSIEPGDRSPRKTNTSTPESWTSALSCIDIKQFKVPILLKSKPVNWLALGLIWQGLSVFDWELGDLGYLIWNVGRFCFPSILIRL